MQGHDPSEFQSGRRTIATSPASGAGYPISTPHRPNNGSLSGIGQGVPDVRIDPLRLRERDPAQVRAPVDRRIGDLAPLPQAMAIVQRADAARGGWRARRHCRSRGPMPV